jgi:hypothetical protein
VHARLTRRENPDVEPDVYLSKLLPGPWQRTVFTADVYLEAPAWHPGDSNSARVWFECWSATSSNAGYCFVENGSTGVGRYPENVTGPAIPTDQWINIGVDFDPIGSTVTARIGEATFSRGLSSVASGASPNCQVRFGINSFNAPIPALSVLYDNVTIDRP